MKFVIGTLLVTSLIINTLGQDPILSISPTKLPVGRYFSAAVYDEEDSIYILGGNGNSGKFNTILKFTVSTEQLESVATLPAALEGSSAIWDGTGVVYFGGYSGNGTYLDDIRRYIPGENVTQAAGILPQGTYLSTAVVVNDAGDTVIFGGEAINTRNKFVKYSSNVATLDGILPYATYGASSIHYSNSNEDSIYIFGGRNIQETGSIIQYDVANRTNLVLTQKLPYPLYASSAIYNGTYAYLFGGWSANSNTNVIRFNPSSKEIVSLNIPNYPAKLYGSSAVFVPKLDRVYIFGGVNGGTASNQIMYLNL